MGMNLVSRDESCRASFDATVWAWRVIHGLVDMANENHQLGISTRGWEHNDGAGLEDASACARLADALEAMLPELGDVITMDQAPERTKAERAMLGALGGSPAPINYQLRKSRIVEFVAFLRECGPGFEIH